MISSISTRRLDQGIARVTARLRTSRSCVVVVRNETPIRWVFGGLTIRCGRVAEAPPATIAPGGFAVFTAEALTARLGAGCEGAARYYGTDGNARLIVSYNVPYAGTAAGDLAVHADVPVAVERVTYRTSAATTVFRFRLIPVSDPLLTNLEDGVPTQP